MANFFIYFITSMYIRFTEISANSKKAHTKQNG